MLCCLDERREILQAKLAAAAEDKWLLANLQSPTEFSSHMVSATSLSFFFSLYLPVYPFNSSCWSFELHIMSLVCLQSSLSLSLSPSIPVSSRLVLAQIILASFILNRNLYTLL